MITFLPKSHQQLSLYKPRTEKASNWFSKKESTMTLREKWTP